MGETIVEVVKIVAPAALDALAKAAAELLSETGIRASAVTDGDDGTVIQQDTQQFVENKFAENYLYYYAGPSSAPPKAKNVLDGQEDIVVWDPSKNETSDITTYMQNKFKFSLPAGDGIQIAGNISQMFQERFGEVDLSWTAYNKTFNMSDMTLDLQMVTAAGYDNSNYPQGVASYCWVAYQ